jgi:ferredoxin
MEEESLQMKTNLFYFSATGNSLVVAKDIAAKLPGTQIFSIPKVINQGIDLNADNIGLIFPVYFGGMPRIIINFINKLEPGKAKYIFAICTCGAIPMGTLLQARKQLEARGLTLDAGFSIQMPGNYIVKYGAFPVEKQKKLFNKEKAKVETIVKMITNQQANKIERNNSLINGIGNLIYRSMLPKFPNLDQNFTVNEKCKSCDICEKICPVQNIKMNNGRPNWQGNCEHCLACIQWCPTEAIQYGAQTDNRKRYRHPEAPAGEIYGG